MTTDIKLTDTQRQVLGHAADQAEGRIAWFPDGVKGGARQKVLDGLANRALIRRQDSDWFIVAEGFEAIGRIPPVPAPVEPDPEMEAAVAAAEAQWANVGQQETAAVVQPARRSREKSKQATVLQMLRRPEGATVHQIVEATGWQPHTVRGTFAGTFKKKLGLTLTSEKAEGGERVYRIA